MYEGRSNRQYKKRGKRVGEMEELNNLQTERYSQRETDRHRKSETET